MEKFLVGGEADISGLLHPLLKAYEAMGMKRKKLDV